MTDRKNFEALLDKYAERRAHWGAVGSLKERAAVLAAYDAAAGREGQPVACIVDDGQERELCWWDEGYSGDVTKLYTHPAPKVDAAAVKEIVAQMRRDLEGVHGFTHGLVSVPAMGIRDYIIRLEAALAASPAPKADAAADWVCVPREPTEEMLRAGHAAYMHGEGGEGGHGGYELERQLYRAMIAASPARGGEKCRYCDGSGEIETDNNGPIAPCPICRPAALSREAQ